MTNLSAEVSTYLLQPCKICGYRYPVVYNDTIERYFQCRCEECKAHTDKYQSEAEAVMAWNIGITEVEW